MSEAILTASLRDEISAGLAAIKGNLGDIGSAARDAMAAVGSVATVAVGGVVAGLGAAGAAAVDFAGDAAQAQRDLQAQLGLTEEATAALGPVAQEVFTNNWGDSIGDVYAMLGDAKQQLGELNNADLGRVTQGAAAIADTFDVDYGQVINSVKAIRDNFPGTTEAEALDLLAKGFQSGLNASGDLLDSVGEYSNQFGAVGASAEQYFGLMQSGLGAGVLGTDKIGDAWKEFNVRILDGSKTTAAALDQLGLDTLLADLNAGKITGADAMGAIVEELGKVDEATRRQAGVALLGTQFEDLGFNVDAFAGIAGTAFRDAEGAVDSLNVKYGSMGDVLEGFKRQALVALEPLGSGLLEIANGAMPMVTAAFQQAATFIQPVVDVVRGLWLTFGEGKQALDLVDSGLVSLFGPEKTEQIYVLAGAVSGAVAQFQAWLPTLQPLIDLIGANLTPILAGVAGVLGGAVVVAVGSAVAAFVAAAVPILALVAAGAALYAAWQSDFGGIRTVTTEVLTNLQTTVSAVLAAVQEFWTAHGDEVMALVGALRDFLEETFRNAMQIIGGIVNTVLAVIRGDWDAAAEGIGQTVDGLMAQVQLLFRTGMGLLEGIVGPPIDAVVGFFTDMPERVKDVGKNIVKAVEDGFRQAWDDFMKLATDSLDAFRNLWPFSEPRDSSSPLYGLGKSGAAIIEMVQAGIDGAGGLTIPGATFGAPNGSLALAGVASFGSGALAVSGGNSLASGRRDELVLRVVVEGADAYLTDPAVLRVFRREAEDAADAVISRYTGQAARLGRNGS
jgi:hypothetical protein